MALIKTKVDDIEVIMRTVGVIGHKVENERIRTI